MTHNMKLKPTPFEQIKSGAKTIELRLYDEKRQQIKIDDDIIFTNVQTDERIFATVKHLWIFKSFEELYSSLPLEKCGYSAKDIKTASPADMNVYYSPEEQSKFGVVGIEIELKETPA